MLQVSHRGQLVKAGKQLVKRHDQLLGRALRRQAGEAFNVGKQYAAGQVWEGERAKITRKRHRGKKKQRESDS